VQRQGVFGGHDLQMIGWIEDRRALGIPHLPDRVGRQVLDERAISLRLGDDRLGHVVRKRGPEL
jgi:hypothetical protein